VVITAPSQATNPNDDTLVTEASLAVRCKVTRSTLTASSPIDKSAVQITLERPEDSTKLIAPAVTALVDDEYQATFDLSAFANGPLHFHCTAKDLATKPHTATVQLDTLLDLGPKIDFMEPRDKGIYTLKTPVSIRFQVSASKVGSTDVEDEIKEVKLNVGGVDTPVQESSTTPGLYQTSVNFDDHTKFPVPPTSAQMVVSVTDARTPTAATRSSKVDIVIDGDGPKIKVDDPPNRKIVHGVQELKLTVTDPSGIKPGSLVADINSGLLVISQWEGKEPSFSQKFDTRALDSDHKLTQLTINITASDGVGNKATVSHQLRLDNLPPLLELDPPYIREERMSGANAYCSAAFDPVGDSAANEGQRVFSSKRYRALVIDQTNHSAGAAVDYLAGVDPTKVVLYVQPDSSLPLLIDTDQDGVCDDINSLDLPEKDRPTQLQLLPVNPGGTAWYSKSINTTNPLHMATRCIADPGGSDTAPTPICPSPYTEMFRVVPGPSQGKPAAVYAVNPSNDGSSGECAGGSWELASIAKEGWLCMAARAEDTIGNIGVSAPLHICFDDGISGNGVPTCTDEPPSCTGMPSPSGCTITPAQHFERDAVWTLQP
jgi:hypothetical protein